MENTIRENLQDGREGIIFCFSDETLKAFILDYAQLLGLLLFLRMFCFETYEDVRCRFQQLCFMKTNWQVQKCEILKNQSFGLLSAFQEKELPHCVADAWFELRDAISRLGISSADNKASVSGDTCSVLMTAEAARSFFGERECEDSLFSTHDHG